MKWLCVIGLLSSLLGCAAKHEIHGANNATLFASCKSGWVFKPLNEHDVKGHCDEKYQQTWHANQPGTLPAHNGDASHITASPSGTTAAPVPEE